MIPAFCTRRPALAAAALLAAAAVSHAQVGVDWITRFDGPGRGNDFPSSIVIDSQGNLVIGGNARQYSQDIAGEFWVAKFSPAGELLWDRNLPIRPLWAAGGAVVRLHLDAQDNIYAGGYANNLLTDRDFAVARFTPSGQVVFARTLDIGTNTDGGMGLLGTEDFVRDVAMSPDGTRMYLVGYRRNSTFFTDFTYVVAAFDALTGEPLWTDRFDNPNSGDRTSDQLTAIVVDAAGDLYVTGNSHNAASGGNIVTIKYSPTGERLWITEFTTPGVFMDSPSDLILGPDGMLYLAGSANAGTMSVNNGLVQKINPANGAVLWQHVFEGEAGGSDTGRRVRVDTEGNVYLAGSTYITGATPNVDNDVYVRKLNADGEVLWTTVRGLRTHSESITEVVLNDNGFYYTANSMRLPQGFVGIDTITAKLDIATGEVLWEEVYDGPAMNADTSRGIALDASRRRVYTISESLTALTTVGGPGYDWAIIAYQEEGAVPTCPADFDNNGQVNTADITAFLSAWFEARAGGQTGGRADFNSDGVVNTGDITAFLSAWFDARAGGC